MRMRIKQMLGVSLCTLMLVGAFDVKAADDSYVDLSVLNNLQPGDSLFVETQPLFPIVKKDTSSAPKAKKAKKKSVKKQSSKAQKQNVEKQAKSSETKAEVKVQEPKIAEEKLNILPQAPVVPQPLAEKKEAEIKPDTQISTEASQAVNSLQQPQKSEEKVVSEEKVSAEPKTAELQSPEQKSEQVQSVTRPAPKAETIPVEKSQSEVKETAAAPQAEPIKDEKATIQPETASSAVQPQAEVKTPQQAENPVAEKVIQPLIPQSSTQQSGADKEEIRFAEGSYEISEENAQKILSLISTFENPQQNKIAIYAYNYDNGENSFKKKKLSLDRATEIRSLLLNKGYKNFSIKVINVTDSPDKSNLVEIEEIK